MPLSIGLAACSANTEDQAGPGPQSTAPPCPTTPVRVTVSVDQWGDIVSTLGGRCAQVTTVLAGSAADPHDFEPSPADAASFTDAQLVVVNGDDYDAMSAAFEAGC